LNRGACWPVKYTVAPAAPKACAIPLPIPRLAPVTRAIVLDKDVIETMIPLKKKKDRVMFLKYEKLLRVSRPAAREGGREKINGTSSNP
jgi:hypothetical protein